MTSGDGGAIAVRDPRRRRPAPPPAQPRRLEGRRLAPRRAVRALGHGRARLQGGHDRHRSGDAAPADRPARCASRSSGKRSSSATRAPWRSHRDIELMSWTGRSSHHLFPVLVPPGLRDQVLDGLGRARDRRGGELPRRAHAAILSRDDSATRATPFPWRPTSANAPSRSRSCPALTDAPGRPRGLHCCGETLAATSDDRFRCCFCTRS